MRFLIGRQRASRASGLPREAVPGYKLESGRRWPAYDLAAAERRAEQDAGGKIVSGAGGR